MSGIYTPDFPNWPESFFNFTADELPLNTTIPTQGTRVKMLDYNEEVEITFQGTAVLKIPQNHPMHMHGYSFYVVGSGFGNFIMRQTPKTLTWLIHPSEYC